MKAKWIGIVAALLVVIAGVGGWLMHMENYDEFYYVKLVYPQAKEGSGTLRYEYTVDAVNEAGKSKSLTFKTSTPLENGQILKLEVRAAGVFHYDLIEADQIPEKIRQQVLQE